MAISIGSVSLFADSIDFLEDASVNFLILVALGWSARQRARVGAGLACLLLVPGLAVLWTAWDKFQSFAAPAPVPLSLAGAGALAVNLSCAFLLVRHRHHAGSLSRAAFLSARNDAPGECGYPRGCGRDRLLAYRLAGFGRWAGNRRHQRRFRARGLAGRA